MKKQTPEPDVVLAKLRAICLSLPDTAEKLSWGHPTFTVSSRTFAIFEAFKKEWCICFCVELAHQELFLKDPRFFMTPYIGPKGWVSLRIHAAPLRWTEIRHLIVESHRLVSTLPKAKSKRTRA